VLIGAVIVGVSGLIVSLGLLSPHSSGISLMICSSSHSKVYWKHLTVWGGNNNWGS